MAQCIITGCALMIEGEGRYLWGDLHAQGDQLIFNGVTADGETFWQSGTPTGNYKALWVRPDVDRFERRGIMVVPRYSSGVYLNEAAKTYLNRGRA